MERVPFCQGAVGVLCQVLLHIQPGASIPPLRSHSKCDVMAAGK